MALKLPDELWLIVIDMLASSLNMKMTKMYTFHRHPSIKFPEYGLVNHMWFAELAKTFYADLYRVMPILKHMVRAGRNNSNLDRLHSFYFCHVKTVDTGRLRGNDCKAIDDAMGMGVWFENIKTVLLHRSYIKMHPTRLFPPSTTAVELYEDTHGANDINLEGSIDTLNDFFCRCPFVQQVKFAAKYSDLRKLGTSQLQFDKVTCLALDGACIHVEADTIHASSNVIRTTSQLSNFTNVTVLELDDPTFTFHESDLSRVSPFLRQLTTLRLTIGRQEALQNRLANFVNFVNTASNLEILDIEYPSWVTLNWTAMSKENWTFKRLTELNIFVAGHKRVTPNALLFKKAALQMMPSLQRVLVTTQIWNDNGRV